MKIDPNVEPDGAIFILKRPDNKVLLMLSDEHRVRFANMWALPGGSCEGDEDQLAACIREAYEEVEASLQPEDCTLLMKRLNDHNWVYVCNVSQDFMPIQHEGKDTAWKTVSELADMELGFEQDDIIPVLAGYLSSLK